MGALLVLILCLTGAVIWWPGTRTWRRSLLIHVRSNSRLVMWSLHSALGFWFFGFIVLWGVTGAYLGFPDVFARAFDYLQPFDESTPERTVDRIQYCSPTFTSAVSAAAAFPGAAVGCAIPSTKATWAVAGLVPPVMFVTGALMWWNRVVRPARRLRSPD
jgi:uncharacterized iron-regulated membrane protein